MARKYDNKNILTPAERKRQSKEKKRYPGGAAIPKNLPESYNSSISENKQCFGCKFNELGFCTNWSAPIKIEYVCNSWASPSSTSLRLQTEQYGTISLKDNIDTTFSEFAKPPIDEDIEQFFQIYREIFYDIPKRGTQSHTTLVEDGKDYIEDYVDPKDTTITALLNKVEALQEQIQEEFSTQSHPFYPDGSILHIPYVEIGIMQNGKYRKIKWSTWLTWSDANPNFKKEDGSKKSISDIAYIFENNSAISTIPKGEEIRTINDFNDYNIEAPSDILNFNKIKNSIDQQRLDLAEIEILRQLLDTKETTVGNNDQPDQPAPRDRTSYSRG